MADPDQPQRKGQIRKVGLIDPVDQHVGSRIKSRRAELGLSQTDLGRAMGITFQQVQKYERGSNRVSASKLWIAAAALGVEIGFFFEGLERPQVATS